VQINSLVSICQIALLAGLLVGCTTIIQPDNEAITQVDENTGYRRLNYGSRDDFGDTLVLLAFSGGGTRAAALSYGVLQELRDTEVESKGANVRLLDEVDSISSVSGGSFTAAYYGVYREKIFEDYEDDFLRLGVQQALIRQLFNPMHWIRSSFSGFDRTEMAIDYYDRKIFHGATFDDIARQGIPFIDINATDLTNGLRFTFTQERFDLICTNLSSYSVARAVTASSAVPVLFPTVVLENHADQCQLEGTREWDLLIQAEARAEGEAQVSLVEGLRSYRDVEERKYIHLVDGGISDNLGLRSMIDRLENLGEHLFEKLKEKPFKNVLVILVNADVEPDRLIEKTAGKPSASSAMGAYASVQIDRYNQETLDRLREDLAELEVKAAEHGLPIRLYFSEVRIDHIKQTEVNNFLNSMPTTLELEDIQVDQLIAAGRLMLRREPAFVQFRQDNSGVLVPDAASSKELCEVFYSQGCPVLDAGGGPRPPH
jgi:NTE family protein